jgi:hypothetical protein
MAGLGPVLRGHCVLLCGTPSKHAQPRKIEKKKKKYLD